MIKSSTKMLPVNGLGSLTALLIITLLSCAGSYNGCEEEEEKEKYRSAVGDPGMRRDGLRVAIEAWNQCNEVGEEAPNMGSPRYADCFDVDASNSPGILRIYIPKPYTCFIHT